MKQEANWKGSVYGLGLKDKTDEQHIKERGVVKQGGLHDELL